MKTVNFHIFQMCYSYAPIAVPKFLVQFFNRFVDVIMAPLYFHFGDCSWFLDALSLSRDLIEIVCLYYVFFFSAAMIVLLKNEKFVALSFSVYKNVTHFYNSISVLNKVSPLTKLYSLLSALSKFFKK